MFYYVWFGPAMETKEGFRRQRTMRTAERIIGALESLPTLQDLHTSRVRKWTDKIITNPTDPSHNLSELLVSGRQCRPLGIKIFPTGHLTHEPLIWTLVFNWKCRAVFFFIFYFFLHTCWMCAILCTGCPIPLTPHTYLL